MVREMKIKEEGGRWEENEGKDTTEVEEERRRKRRCSLYM